MKSYRVEWNIDIAAESPRAAAIEALKVQQDPFSEAITFRITNMDTNKVTVVDLLSDEDMEG